MWQRVSDPGLWPAERLFFECYARATRGEPPFASLLPGLVDDWLDAAVRLGLVWPGDERTRARPGAGRPRDDPRSAAGPRRDEDREGVDEAFGELRRRWRRPAPHSRQDQDVAMKNPPRPVQRRHPDAPEPFRSGSSPRSRWPVAHGRVGPVPDERHRDAAGQCGRSGGVGYGRLDAAAVDPVIAHVHICRSSLDPGGRRAASRGAAARLKRQVALITEKLWRMRVQIGAPSSDSQSVAPEPPGTHRAERLCE